jgi:tetratricopeptide (TPR) repeat protein
MHKLVLLFLLLGCSSAFGQFSIGAQGVYQIINVVSSLGREAVIAAEYRKSKKEQQAHEAEYMTALQSADSLFLKEKYSEAINQYNRALQFRQDEYAISQIARSNTELARIDLQRYEALLDTADAKYIQLDYKAAIQYYTTALEIREEEYPRAKIELAQAKQELWKKVHFSTMLISDSSVADLSSQAFGMDSYSNFIPLGQYPVLNDLLGNSANQTPNGIAIPANVHFVLYSETHFKGKILVDVVGPAIINNGSKKNHSTSVVIHSKTFSPALQKIFPQTLRNWSASDMKDWYKGSMEIKREGEQ